MERYCPRARLVEIPSCSALSASSVSVSCTCKLTLTYLYAIPGNTRSSHLRASMRAVSPLLSITFITWEIGEFKI